jgi:hypothetical protein
VVSDSAAQTPRQASIYTLVKRVRWASGNGRRIRVQPAAQGRRSFPWEQLPEAAQRNIVAAMWVCLAVGFVAGVAVGILLVEWS